jgi:hypothetical protein
LALQGSPIDPASGRAREPGPAWRGPGAAGRALASAGGKLHGAGWAWPGAQDCDGYENDGIYGGWDADRFDGGGGCELFGILWVDGGVGAIGGDGVRMHRMNHFIVVRNNPQSATLVHHRLFT